MTTCILFTRGYATAPNDFQTWWLGVGRPYYLGLSHKWVIYRPFEIKNAPTDIAFVVPVLPSAITVGWSETRSSDIWNHADCLWIDHSHF